MTTELYPIGTVVRFNAASQLVYKRINQPERGVGTGKVLRDVSNGLEMILLLNWEGYDEPRRIHPGHLERV